MNAIRVFGVVIVTIFSAAGAELEAEKTTPFAKGSHEVAATIGAGPSSAILGSTIGHDMAISVMRYGLTLSDTFAKDTFREGHWELLGELFGGAQYNPRVRYVTGLLPAFRYNFTEYEPFVPFFDVGAGVTLTDIFGPDLSGVFQFNLQTGVGAHYFFAERTAITVEYRFMHISNAGISQPNRGVNANIFSIGLTRFF
ncbi:MAG TPA: acyloxyacyl hydrolase [Candidatus Binatia bacterium]|nr:acyloxyacyl hydrolase [Candidatus Binatia bacterium]